LVRDDRSAETAEAGLRLKTESDLWLFRQIPFRDALKNRMEKLVELRKNRLTFKGNFTYYSKNNGLQNQSVMYEKMPLEKKRFS
jgi:prolyl oligopeptidase